MIEEALTAYLQADSGLDTVISGRVYPLKLPQNGTLPAVTYYKVGGSRNMGLAGAFGSAQSRFRLDGWADSYSTVKALEVALMAAMDDFTGASAAMPPIDFYEDDTGIYRISIDYYIHHSEV